ncbi:porin family protein [Aggregatibacter kilianii]|uniref:porin family protein n=1 Tax=Aggregatibacter kilianii TaxID=2025884 RepID=UPI000D696F49|nr:porin family protein [Aggregatibacter kilianii]
MKKLTLLALSAAVLVSTSAVASDFTGFGLGVGVGTTKYKDAKRISNVDLIGDYGIDYGNNLVGVIEGKLKLNNSTLHNENGINYHHKLTEKTRLGVSYLQGYRVTPNVLPYAKLGLQTTKFKREVRHGSRYATHSDTQNGIGFGAGVKASLTPNFELGVEYLRTHDKFDGEKLRGNTFSTNATYRF